jgi:hypothetical protein
MLHCDNTIGKCKPPGAQTTKCSLTSRSQTAKAPSRRAYVYKINHYASCNAERLQYGIHKCDFSLSMTFETLAKGVLLKLQRRSPCFGLHFYRDKLAEPEYQHPIDQILLPIPSRKKTRRLYLVCTISKTL